MQRKQGRTTLAPETRANIRAIFVHNGESVAVDEAARLLGWGIDTMDAAIKWQAIKLDERSKNQPRISRRELLEAAIDQWSLAEIKAALSRDEWKALVSFCGAGYGALVVRDRDTLRAAAGHQAEQAAASAVLLKPAAEAELKRRAARERKAAVIVPEQFKRRRRTDGVREVTMTALSDGDSGLVPMLRLRGRWLARLGFKQGMRVYIVETDGAMIITTSDPAKVRKQSTAQLPRALAAASPLPLADGDGQVADTAVVHVAAGA
jgi:hypothetical protein